MPSAQNQYKPGMRISNTAKQDRRSSMAPGAMTPAGIDLGVGEPLMLPRNTLSAPRFPMTQAQPVQYPTQPQAPVQAVTQAAPMQQVQAQQPSYPGQAAAALPFPTAPQAPQAPPMVSQPMYSTQAQPAESPPDFGQIGAAVNEMGTDEQLLGSAFRGMVGAQTSAPPQEPQTSAPDYSKDRDQATSALNAQYESAMQGALKQMQDYYGRLGLSGSGMEQAAMLDLYAQTEKDKATAIAQMNLEYSSIEQRERMAYDAWKRMEPMFKAQLMNEIMDTLAKAGADMKEVYGWTDQELASFFAKTQGGKDPMQAFGEVSQAKAAHSSETKPISSYGKPIVGNPGDEPYRPEERTGSYINRNYW